MFLYKNRKKLGHKQTSIIGFVLAVFSLLVSAIVVYIFPNLGAWLNMNSVFSLDLFLLVFMVVVFLSLQGLILFGFPLYYAQDKKSHMTGFQILLYAIMWMIIIVLVLSFIFVQMAKQDAQSFDLDDFAVEEIESVESVETVE